ncbi:MAG: hemerythrin domain-containing protein [Desulfamplus sp.]|nr:hemerythrin domain-containing protein [Desulfamplus sp.]
MNVIHILKTEHQLILKVLALLSIARKELESGRMVSTQFFEKAMVFCSEFADRFHHFKEEFLLFGLLSHKKDGELDSAMGALRYQHERCTQCISSIREVLQGYENMDEMAITLMLENLSVYVSLLSRHIYQEDYIFFPMVEKSVSSDESFSLNEQFANEELRSGKKGSIFEKSRLLADELGKILNIR